MARTVLPAELLARLHTEGRMAASRSRFVDPNAVADVRKLLAERGEEWAASVLMRDIARRSIACPQLPWLDPGELETLVLADKAEFEHVIAGL
ncbi:hypothetical protein MAHJHV63_52750 [Mycobacterium avium subsp. hominissuis]